MLDAGLLSHRRSRQWKPFHFRASTRRTLTCRAEDYCPASVGAAVPHAGAGTGADIAFRLTLLAGVDYTPGTTMGRLAKSIINS